jgi:hypothetical protein
VGGGYGTVIETEWWLLSAALPDLNWARLSLFHDGSARLRTSEGRRLYFPSDVEARLHLSAAEYVRPEDLAGMGPVEPRTGHTAKELLPQMYVRAGEPSVPPGAGFTVRRRRRWWGRGRGATRRGQRLPE